jgi:solute carrier family 9 (sodium/hydrogen exchanger), member 6/7
MLEVLGIRTGVEDDGASSSEEEDGVGLGAGSGAARNIWYRKAARGTGRWGQYMDDEPSYLASTSRHGGGRGEAARIGAHYAPYNHHAQSPVLQQNNYTNTMFSTASSDSYDSDGMEVLPMASTSAQESGEHPPRDVTGRTTAGVGEDGKWFQALDERYLLPLFSNATASRTFHARKARRNGVGPSGGGGSGAGTVSPGGSALPADSEDEGEDVTEVALGSYAASRGMGRGRGRGVVGQEFSHSPTGTEESRIERGLPSPKLRSSSGDRFA